MYRNLSFGKIRKLIITGRNSLKYRLNDYLDKLRDSSKEFERTTGTRIVLYHGIDKYGSSKYNTRFISATTFEEHLKLYKKYTNILSVKQIFDGEIKKDAFNLAITFDDGYANNLKYALPLLNKYEIPSTFFITGVAETQYPCLWTDYVDLASSFTKKSLVIGDQTFTKRQGRIFNQYYDKNGKTLKEFIIANPGDLTEDIFRSFELEKESVLTPGLQDYWRPMNTCEITELAQTPKVTIGSHGYLHQNMCGLDLEKVRDDLLRSRTYLENASKMPVDLLAFPYGLYNQAIKELAADLGFSGQLAIDFVSPEDHGDPRILQRMTINPFISPMNQLRMIMRGSYY